MGDGLKITKPAKRAMSIWQADRGVSASIKMPARVSYEAEFEQWLELLLQSEREQLRNHAAIKRLGARDLAESEQPAG